MVIQGQDDYVVVPEQAKMLGAASRDFAEDGGFMF